MQTLLWRQKNETEVDGQITKAFICLLIFVDQSHTVWVLSLFEGSEADTTQKDWLFLQHLLFFAMYMK